jgi:hypothetical protein
VPHRLPKKSGVDVIRDKPLSAANKHLHTDTRASSANESIDWLALWALSLALSAMFAAGLVYFSEGDINGAAAILVGAAIIIAFARFASKAPSARG